MYGLVYHQHNCNLKSTSHGRSDIRKRQIRRSQLLFPSADFRVTDLRMKQDSSRKILFSTLLTMPKPLTVWITTNWKILKEMGMPGHITCLLRNLYAGQEATVRTRQRQWTGSELGKEYIKAACCHTAYLTYMQSTPCEMPGWMKHKLESRLL